MTCGQSGGSVGRLVEFPGAPQLPLPDGVFITRGFVPQRGKLARVACDQCDGVGRHLCLPRAEKVVRIFAEILVHTKGRWARRPFVLEPWQRDEIVVPVFGVVEWDAESERWVRTYRTLWIEVPRKNGKSEICAGIALVLLAGDGEEGAEIYGAALDTKQAKKVFDVADRMVELSPPLRGRIDRYKRNRMVFAATGSYYETVPADASGNLGHNPHGGIVDEAQEQPNGDLWDAIRQGMGTRTQPLMVAALTAGNRPKSWAAGEHDYSVKVAKDASLNPRRFVYVRGAPKDADWRDEQVWRNANPALGSFLSMQSMRDEAKEAEQSIRKQMAFRQYRLNQWLQQAHRWLELERWDASAGLVPAESELRHRACTGGIDLSTTADLAGYALCFPPDGYKLPEPASDDPDDERVIDETTEPFDFLWRLFLPEATLQSLRDRTNGEADEWVRDGLLTVTEGDVLDYSAVRMALRADTARFEIRELGYDPWNATEFVEQRLGDRDGFKVVPVRQGYASMSPPSKEFERLVLSQRVRHGGNQALRWMIDNVMVTRDPAGNIKPDKAKSGEKIDGVVMAIIALERAMRSQPPKRSAYESRGVVVAGRSG